MGAQLALLTLSSSDLSVFQRLHRQLAVKPGLWAGYTIGGADVAIVAEGEKNSEVLRDILEKFHLRPGYQCRTSPGGSRVYVTSLRKVGTDPRTEWTESIRDEPVTIVLARRCRNRETPMPDSPANGYLWSTAGHFDLCMLAPADLSRSFSSVVLPLRNNRWRTYALPAVGLNHLDCQAKARRCPDGLEGCEDAIEYVLHPAITIKPGREHQARDLFRQAFGDRADLHIAHGRRDVFASEPLRVCLRKYLRTIESFRSNDVVVSTHTRVGIPYPTNAPRNNLTGDECACETCSGSVSPFEVSTAIEGFDCAERQVQIARLQELVFDLAGCRLDQLSTRFVGGGGVPATIVATNPRNDEVRIEICVAYEQVTADDWFLHILHETVAAALRVYMSDVVQIPKLNGAGLEVARVETEYHRMIASAWRQLGEGLGTAIGLEYVRRHRRAGDFLAEYAKLAIMGGRSETRPPSPAHIARLLLGEFLRRWIVAVAAGGDHTKWHTSLREARDEVTSWLTGVGLGPDPLFGTPFAQRIDRLAAKFFLCQAIQPAALEAYIAHGDPNLGYELGTLSLSWSATLGLGAKLMPALSSLVSAASDTTLDSVRPAARAADLPMADMAQSIVGFLLSADRIRAAWGSATTTDRLDERVVRYVDAFLGYRPPFHDEAAERGVQRDILHQFVNMGRAEWDVLAAFEESRAYHMVANKEYFYTCSSDNPEPAGYESLAGASAATPGDTADNLLPMIGVGARKDVRFGDVLSGYVGTDSDLSAIEYCRAPTTLARRIDCELRCLDAAGEALAGYNPQPSERYVSVNVTPWLIADPRGVVRQRRWHASYLGRLKQTLKSLAAAAEAARLRLVVELVEGALPRSGDLQEELWETLGVVADSAGLAIDDQFGPGTDTPRLARILERAKKLGFSPIIAKLDYLAVSEVLSHFRPSTDWSQALGVLGDHVMLVGLHDCTCLVFEGYSGKNRSDEYRRDFREALASSRVGRNWPEWVLMQG